MLLTIIRPQWVYLLKKNFLKLNSCGTKFLNVGTHEIDIVEGVHEIVSLAHE